MPTPDRRRVPTILALLTVVAATSPQVLPSRNTSDLEPLIRGRVEALRAGAPVRAGDVRLQARTALPLFYEARAFIPAWTDGPTSLLDALEASLERSAEHGLDPRDYHLETIRQLRAAVRDTDSITQRVDLELLATDAFLVLGSHLLLGRVNPETVEPEWLANRRTAALHETLAQALGTDAVEETLYGLAPQQPRYDRMRQAALRLRKVADDGGWPTVPDAGKLEVGSTGPAVARLRARLAASGDLAASGNVATQARDVDGGPGSAGDSHFDEPLAEAVRRFQQRHGLDADGVVGPMTLAALNVPAAARARQVELNMERWRWLPEDLGARHIEVNIASFQVTVVENGRVARRHRAVVGRQYRQTPMFSGTMTYLVLSPYWHVPPTIAAVDKLPLIRQDPGYVAAQNMTLLSQATGRPVPVGSVDWASMTGAAFNQAYRLRQDPGPSNALGRVKFMFPNRHNVYLHDTPSRELFARASRGFSSGCIRIEDPLDLAEYLLADQPGWSRQRIDAVVAGGVEQSVTLSTRMPVHLLYWTAWADADGVMHFRDDLYGRDQAVWRGVTADPPGA